MILRLTHHLILIRVHALAWLIALGGCGASRGHGFQASKAGHPPLTRWLGDDVALARAAGADEALIIVAEAGAVGDRFTRVVETNEHDCLLVMARASEKIADADLYAYSEDGTALGIDDRSDPRPTLLLCPPQARHVYLTARIAAGQGFVVVGIQRVPRDRARRVRATLRPAELHPQGEASEVAIPDVDRRLNEHLQALGGYWTPIAQTSVAVDSRIPSVTGIVIEPHSCVDALVLAPLAVSGLELEAIDESGRTLGRAPNTEKDKWIVVCTDEKRSFALQLRPHEGTGTVLVLVSRGAQQAGRSRENQIELGQSLSIEQVTARVHEQLKARRQPIGKLLTRLTLSRGVQERLEDSPAQGCNRYDVFAGAPSLDVQARAYSAKGELIAQSEGGQHLPLFSCEKSATTLVFDAHTRGGPLLIEKCRLESPAPAILENQRAASRLLTRAWQLGLVLNSDELNAARKISIAAKKPWSQEIVTPAGQCTDILAALDGEPQGLEISRVHSDTNEPDDGEQHPHSAHLQLCCPASSSDCRHPVRVSTSAPAANALVAISTRL